MDELVDQAMAAHIAAFVHAIRGAVAERTDPIKRFWAAVEAYLALFHDEPRAIVLWHEYWLHCVRQGRLTRIEEMFNDVTEIFLDLLSATPVEDAGVRARMLSSYLIGAATRQAITERPFAAVQTEISLICPVS